MAFNSSETENSAVQCHSCGLVFLADLTLFIGHFPPQQKMKTYQQVLLPTSDIICTSFRLTIVRIKNLYSNNNIYYNICIDQ